MMMSNIPNTILQEPYQHCHFFSFARYAIRLVQGMPSSICAATDGSWDPPLLPEYEHLLKPTGDEKDVDEDDEEEEGGGSGMGGGDEDGASTSPDYSCSTIPHPMPAPFRD